MTEKSALPVTAFVSASPSAAAVEAGVRIRLQDEVGVLLAQHLAQLLRVRLRVHERPPLRWRLVSRASGKAFDAYHQGLTAHPCSPVRNPPPRAAYIRGGLDILS